MGRRNLHRMLDSVFAIRRLYWRASHEIYGASYSVHFSRDSIEVEGYSESQELPAMRVANAGIFEDLSRDLEGHQGGGDHVQKEDARMNEGEHGTAAPTSDEAESTPDSAAIIKPRSKSRRSGWVSTSRLVSNAELALFRGFVLFYRRQIFLRYQVRAQQRFLVSLVMILTPLLARNTNLYYFSGYPRGELAASLVVPIIFWLEDLIEWYLITFRFSIYDDDGVRHLVPTVLKLFRPDDPTAYILQMALLGQALYYCCLLYTTRWRAYDLGTLRSDTGQEDLSWDHIYDLCLGITSS
ncbi:unnamed protein product [Amoebophrya sp. A25]|nr:unnamed protein product [Amoebophrya sp. A25]|eukprot:GSA25T00005398001.1